MFVHDTIFSDAGHTKVLYPRMEGSRFGLLSRWKSVKGILSNSQLCPQEEDVDDLGLSHLEE